MSLDYRRRFIEAQGFGLDRFQDEALDAVDADVNVLVSAPTGSGKTLIANYAIGRVLEQRQRAFYTTPLKALSNQKYAELCEIYGEDRVGLLTGDTSVNRLGDVVVMTTEVLRNMLLTDSDQLMNLGLVVLDEVHYLQDPFRGGVWEEVLSLTPAPVRFVALSATIGNADFLGEWLSEVRGPTPGVIERTPKRAGGEHALPKEPAICFGRMQTGQRRQRVIERGTMNPCRAVHVTEFEPPQVVGQATSPPPCDG